MSLNLIFIVNFLCVSFLGDVLGSANRVSALFLPPTPQLCNNTEGKRPHIKTLLPDCPQLLCMALQTCIGLCIDVLGDHLRMKKHLEITPKLKSPNTGLQKSLLFQIV